MWFFIVSAVVAAAYGIVSVYMLEQRKADVRLWSAATAALVWIAIIGVRLQGGTAWSATPPASTYGAYDARRAAALAWPGTRTPSPATAAALPAAGNAAPIASLIGGLEQRLSERPNDAKGWALLAQSYAFVGDTDGAAQAAQRAVELGFDAQALDERVALARRVPVSLDAAGGRP